MIAEDSGYQEYRLTPDFQPWFERRQKRRMWTLVMVQIFTIAVFLLLFVNWRSPAALVIAALVIVLIAVVMVVKVPGALRRQLEDYAGFRLYVGPAGVRRVMGDHADLSLSKGDIQKIVLRIGEGIVITGTGGIKLWIPEHMDQCFELERRLNELEPVERIDAASGGLLAPRYMMLRTVLMMFGSLVVSVVVVLIGGFTLLEILVIAVSSFMIWKYKGNPNIGRRMVRANVTTIALMVLLLLMHFINQATR